MLEAFQIFFGTNRLLSSDDILTRMLMIGEWDTKVDFDSEGTKALITTTESLFIRRVKNCVSVSEMDPKGFLDLKQLDLQRGEEIQYIVTKNYRNCIFRKLETLIISRFRKLERICDDHDYPLLVGSFENLRILDVRSCDNLKDLFSFYLARRLLILKEIILKRCYIMENIIVSREIGNEDEIIIGFTHQLRLLKLHCLSRLVSFYSCKPLEGHPSPTHLFNKKITFPKLEALDLKSIEIEKIWDDHLAITTEGTCWLQNLTRVEVSYCHNLKYVFTSAMVISLAQLKRLQVQECESIEEIVTSTEGAMAGDVQLSFPKLDYLKLSCLPKLKRFCHANESCLFDEKIVFPKLEELVLSNMEIERIWDLDHLAITSEGTCWFQNITSLKLFKCDNLKYVFTSSMVKCHAKLKQLEVRYCDSIEGIVASTEREMKDIQLSLPKLDNIELRGLPKLKRFCHANLLECQLLRELIIQNCSELKTFVSANNSSSPDNSTIFFTQKIAFPNMEKLEIDGCDSIEKVFDVQRFQMNGCIILPFQNLQSLIVSKCQSLTSIIPTSLILTCQQIEGLEVRNCDKIDLFSFINIQLLIDAFDKAMSSLKYFYLESRGLKLKYESQRFKLEIAGSDFEVPPIFFALLQSCPKLDEVVVSTVSIIQLFSCETDDLAADAIDTQAKTLVRIRLLKLTELFKMEHIWSEHDHGIPRNPEVLEVSYCGSLLSVAPPSTTLFKNLTGLVVRRCPMLIKLVAFSATAKSLVNVKEMSVQECDSLEEIVVIDDQFDELTSNTHECIVFDKLEVLKLLDMDSLTSFNSTSDRNFRFPSLNRVIVVECLKMKFFCKGDLSTPKLIRVEVEEYKRRDGEFEARWEGDLNATIRQMFEESEKKRKEEEEKKRKKDEDEDEED